MQLHHEVFGRIDFAQFHQQACLVFCVFRFRNAVTSDRFGVDGFNFFIRGFSIVDLGQAVVGNVRTMIRKILDPLFHSFQQLSECRHFLAGRLLHFSDEPSKLGCVLDSESFIRTETRNDGHIECLVFSDCLVPLQRIRRVVCRTNEGDVGIFDQLTRCKFFCLQHAVAFRINFLPVCAGKCFFYMEILFQFQGCPVEQRVPYRIFSSVGPSFKFFFRRSIAGNFFFRNSHCTHRAPFIMISAQP